MSHVYLTAAIKAIAQDTREMVKYMADKEIEDIRNGEYQGYIPDKLKRNLDILKEETGVEWEILRNWLD